MHVAGSGAGGAASGGGPANGSIGGGVPKVRVPIAPQVPLHDPVTATAGVGVPLIVAFGLFPSKSPASPTLHPFKVNCVFPIPSDVGELPGGAVVMRQLFGLPGPATARAPGVRLVNARKPSKNDEVDSDTITST